MKNGSEKTCSKFFNVTNDSHIMGNVCNTNKVFSINLVYLKEAIRPVDITRSQNDMDFVMQKATGYTDVREAITLRAEKMPRRK